VKRGRIMRRKFTMRPTDRPIKKAVRPGMGRPKRRPTKMPAALAALMAKAKAKRPVTKAVRPGMGTGTKASDVGMVKRPRPKKGIGGMAAGAGAKTLKGSPVSATGKKGKPKLGIGAAKLLGGGGGGGQRGRAVRRRRRR